MFEDGQKRGGLVYPGQVFEIKGVTYLFREPAAYPGFRIKTQPEWTLWMLYLSFAPMAFLLQSYAALQPREITELMPALKSAWFGLHSYA